MKTNDYENQQKQFPKRKNNEAAGMTSSDLWKKNKIKEYKIIK